MSDVTLITGGAGFIGSHFTDYVIGKGGRVLVVDKLTYAGNLKNLEQAFATGKLVFAKEDVCNTEKILNLLREHEISKVFHLAAESHVDNSIDDAFPFVQTNVVGTLSMLTAVRQYWEEKNNFEKFRFVHVSTDEVFGSLKEGEAAFSETSSYAPNSPYSASKAAGDHFVSAAYKTYGLPCIITHCSNNYGSRQNEEKLIPKIINCALEGKPVPIYGDGRNIRDWLYVKEFCAGLYLAGELGVPGERYCFGADNQKRNIELAEEICLLLDRKYPKANEKSYAEQISFVEDRKGHDWRYDIDSSRARNELQWVSKSDFTQALDETVEYFLSQFPEKKSS